MKYNTVDIRFEGSKFYPSRLKDKIQHPIDILAEYGQIASKGRYKGEPSPYGIGLLEISSPEKQNNVNDLIQEYCLKLLEWKSDLKECGVEEIIIDVENSRDFPIDVSLSNDMLQGLSSINARIEFHSINEEDNVNDKADSIGNPKLNKDELYKKVLTSLKKHPLINNADAIPYFILFYSTKQYSGDLDENLNKFEDFYKRAIA